MFNLEVIVIELLSKSWLRKNGIYDISCCLKENNFPWGTIKSTRPGESNAVGSHSTGFCRLAFTEVCLGGNPSAPPEGYTGNNLIKSALVKTRVLYTLYGGLFLWILGQNLISVSKKSALWGIFQGHWIVQLIRLFFLPWYLQTSW